MGDLTNHEKAAAFLDQIGDPIVKNLLQYLYQRLWLSDAVPEGDFDLLYFFQIMEEVMQDREGLIKALRGEYEEGRAGLGE